MQALLFVCAWSQDGKRALGVTYSYGRCKGKLCYSKELKQGLWRFMGIKHKQAVRYLNLLRDKHWIKTTNQYNLDGKLEYRISPNDYLIAQSHNKNYFVFNLTGAGKKDFDIFSELERSLNENNHPAELDKNQLKFNIPDRTRRHRKRRHALREKARKAQILKNRQKMTPHAGILVPVLKNRNTGGQKNFKKNYNGELDIKLSQEVKKKIPWYLTRSLSEHNKACLGLPRDARAIFWKGQVFTWNPYFSQYELVAGITAKKDPLPGKIPKKQRKTKKAKNEIEFFIPNAHAVRQVELEKLKSSSGQPIKSI